MSARARLEWVQWSSGRDIGSFQSGTDSTFLHELHRRLEKVHHRAQFVSVEIIDGLQGGWRSIAQVANDFTHMGPVFLFDMSVAVFFVGAPSGKLDFSLITEGFEMVVDKLRSIIGIDTEQFEGQTLFDVFHGR